MKAQTLKLSAALLLSTTSVSAHANHYEHCVLDGFVTKALKPTKGSSKIEFYISSSTSGSFPGEESYGPKTCAGYTGKTIAIQFFTKKKTYYSPYQSLKVLQIVATETTPDGIVTLTGWEVISP